METIQIDKMEWVVMPEFVVVPEVEQVRKKERSVAKSKAKPRRRVAQSKQIFARAKLYGLENVRKVGEGGLIDQPMETNGWLAMPLDMYDGIIPREAWDAAETLTKGIAIKGFLIADDKRVVDRKLQRQEVVNRIKSVDWERAASTMGRAAAAIAVVGLVIAALPVVVMFGVMLGALTLYDPLLIAVTEDDEWICVYEWWH